MSRTREEGLTKFQSMMGDAAHDTFKKLTLADNLVGDMARLPILPLELFGPDQV